MEDSTTDDVSFRSRSTSAAFGIRNENYQPGDSGYGVPHPGILFLNSDGIVELKFAAPGFRNRPSFEAVYEALGGK